MAGVLHTERHRNGKHVHHLAVGHEGRDVPRQDRDADPQRGRKVQNAALYTYEQALETEQSILRIVQKYWVGSITLTAPCGCSYRFEKTEHHPEYLCDTHWVRAVFNCDVDE